MGVHPALRHLVSQASVFIACTLFPRVEGQTQARQQRLVVVITVQLLVPTC